MRIILNKCYGGFNVSGEAYKLYAKKKGIRLYSYALDIDRMRFVQTDGCGDGLGVYYYTKNRGNIIRYEDGDDGLFYISSEFREDPTLIEVVEELGDRASGICSKLVVVEVPDGMDYVIDEYDGFETLHQKVRVW